MTDGLTRIEEKMELSDLTKDELLKLIRQQFFRINPKDVLGVRWESVTEKARKLCDEACLEMHENHGPENYKKWKAASDKFDSGQRMYKEADRLFEKLMKL